MRVTLPQIHIRHALFTFNALRSTHCKSVKAGKECNPKGFHHFTNALVPWLIPKFEIATLPSADVAHGSTLAKKRDNGVGRASLNRTIFRANCARFSRSHSTHCSTFISFCRRTVLPLHSPSLRQPKCTLRLQRSAA